MVSKLLLDELAKMPRSALINLHAHIGRMITAARQDEECAKSFRYWYDGLPSPMKKAPRDAQKSWTRIWCIWKHSMDKSMCKTMVDAIDDQVANEHFRGRDGESYYPRAATWLNGGRWGDAVERRRTASGEASRTVEEPNRPLTPEEKAKLG
jgi:hypothetical protein